MTTNYQVPKGYKLTEVGVIPEDWELKSIGDIANIIDPQPDHRTPPEISGGEPYIGISDFVNDTFIDWDGCRKIVQKAVDKQQASFQIAFGDIIFGKIGTIGAPKFLPIPPFRYALSANVILIKPRIPPYFLMSWLKSSLVQKHINQELHSTSQAAFGILKMRSLLIPIPPLSEQEAIALVLSDTDALITSLDKLIAKKRDIKQAAMQQLLTGKQRLEGFGDSSGKFKQTEIGLIPEDWEIVSFQEIYLEPSRNGLSRPQNVRGCGYKMINMGELFAYSQISNQDMEKVEMSRSELSRFSLTSGDLLFARQSLVASGVGKCSIFLGAEDGEIITFESHIIRVRLNNRKAISEYYYHIFNSTFGSQRVRSLVTQIAAAGIKGSELARLHLPLPPLTEQQAIAKVLSDMDSEISALEQRRDKTKALKQAMMQELLTGRIRLL